MTVRPLTSHTRYWGPSQTFVTKTGGVKYITDQVRGGIIKVDIYLHNISSVHRPAVLGLGAGGEGRGPQEEEEVRGGAAGADREDGAGAPGEGGLQAGGGEGAAAASPARRCKMANAYDGHKVCNVNCTWNNIQPG